MPKKQKTYTSEEMKQLKARLIERRGYLASAATDKLAEFMRAPDFDLACEARDIAQQLTTLCLCLGNMDMCIALAEMKNQPGTIPHLDDCGLEGERT